MQRILRINVRSRNTALKATRKKTRETARKDWKDFDDRHLRIEKLKNEYIRAEKKARREDWTLGPLAPKRDVGTKQGFYGMADSTLTMDGTIPLNARKGPKGAGWDPVGSEGFPGEQKEWEGTGNEGNIVEGDRVVVVKGHPDLVGQISKVTEVLNDTRQVKLQGLNLADVEVPENFPEQHRKMKFQIHAMPIPIQDVRLIHRLTDETTGTDRDVVVKLVRGGAPYLQRDFNSPLPRHTRYIVGEDIEIPWPDVDIPSAEAYEGDTSRYDVEAKSFLPSVYNSGIPTAVFEELSLETKYKTDRQWHEKEYMRLKILEDARAQWYADRKIQGPRENWIEEKKKKAALKTESIKAGGMTRMTERIIEEEMEARRHSAPKKKKWTTERKAGQAGGGIRSSRH